MEYRDTSAHTHPHPHRHNTDTDTDTDVDTDTDTNTDTRRGQPHGIWNIERRERRERGERGRERGAGGGNLMEYRDALCRPCLPHF